MANMDKLVEGTGKLLASSQGRKALETVGVFFARPFCRFLQNKNVGYCSYKM